MSQLQENADQDPLLDAVQRFDTFDINNPALHN